MVNTRKNILIVLLVVTEFCSLCVCPPKESTDENNCETVQAVVEQELVTFLKTAKTFNSKCPIFNYCLMDSERLHQACDILLNVALSETKFSIIHKKGDTYECQNFRISWATIAYGLTSGGVILPLAVCPLVKETVTETEEVDGQLKEIEYDEYVQYYVLGFGNIDTPILFRSTPEKKTGLRPKLDKLFRALTKPDKRKPETNDKPGESSGTTNDSQKNSLLMPLLGEDESDRDDPEDIMATPLFEGGKSDQLADDTQYYIDDSKTRYRAKHYPVFKFDSMKVPLGVYKNSDILPFAIVRLDERRWNDIMLMLVTSQVNKTQAGSSSSSSVSEKIGCNTF